MRVDCSRLARVFLLFQSSQGQLRDDTALEVFHRPDMQGTVHGGTIFYFYEALSDGTRKYSQLELSHTHYDQKLLKFIRIHEHGRMGST